MTPCRLRRVPGAFTLIEIIVAITIIGILASLVLMGAHHIRGNARTTTTRDLIKVLDVANSSFCSERQAIVPAVWRDAAGNEFGVVDGRVEGAEGDEPSLALYVLATGSHQLVKDAILRADAKYVVNTSATSFQMQTSGTQIDAVPVMKDAWGNAIRFVHPRYGGGCGRAMGASGVNIDREPCQLSARRANGSSVRVNFNRSWRPAAGQRGTADEGIASGGRGYFYSMGEDGDPGTRDDNVYLDVAPQFPAETAKLR